MHARLSDSHAGFRCWANQPAAVDCVWASQMSLTSSY